MDVLDEQIKELVTHIHDHTTTQTAFTRRRKLDAETLIRCILDLEGNSLNIELRNAFPDLETRMTASAFVQARAKLLPSAFEELFHSFNDTAHDHKTIRHLRQYRLLAVDGTTFYLPHKAGSKYEMAKPAGRPRNDGQPNKKQSLCAANLIYDLLDNTYEDCVLQPRQHIDERAAFLKMVERFPKRKPFIIIGDRGYAGTNVFEHLNRTENCYWIIREQIIGSATPTEVLSLPDTDCDRDVEIHCTTSKTRYTQLQKQGLTARLVKTPGAQRKRASQGKGTRYTRWDFDDTVVKFRLVKFRINDPDTGREEWEVLATNLSRFEFPLNKMRELYHLRWGIETSFRSLKYALGAMHFHSLKDESVESEIWAHLTMFNLASRIAATIVIDCDDKKYSYKVDFKMCITILRNFFRLWCHKPPDEMMVEMMRYTVPIRPGRADKRHMVKASRKAAVWFLYRVA